MSRPRIAVAIQKPTVCRNLPDDASIRRWIRAAAAEAPAAGEVTVRLVDEAESAALNARYRDRRGPTNVLSFPSEALGGLPEEASAGAADGPWPLGDLVVCAPVVEREAAEQGKSLEAHWAHMLVHGCLHLLGYDHEAEPEAQAMEARERRLLGELGFPDPYEAGDPVLASDKRR